MASDPEPDLPSVLSMEVDDENEDESHYRIRIGNKVKYLRIATGTFDRATLSSPLADLPPLPYEDDSWTVAHVFRDPSSGSLQTSVSEHRIPGVENVWHSARVDVLDLRRVQRLTASTFEAEICDSSAIKKDSSMPTRVVAKIARFEWEIPRIERETRAYQLLEQRGAGLAPRFLGHVHEGGRIMGFVIEKLEERRHASVGDLSACEKVLSQFHGFGFLHGDVNRYNFLVGKDGVTLIDFEAFEESATEEARREEMESLRAEFLDESGRGAGFVFSE